MLVRVRCVLADELLRGRIPLQRLTGSERDHDQVADDGGLTVDAVGPRAVVPTNLMLMGMVAALAARIEECCAQSPAPPTP